MEEKQSKRILIVEDDMIIAMVLEKMLIRLNYGVIGKYTDASEAIEAAIKQKPDLILMDIQLKGELDGVTAMQQIQKHIDIPVIYITGNSDQLNQERTKKTRFVSYLVKPIQMNDLEESLKKAFQS